MGLFSIFGTSLRAMNAYSGALSVVADNVANSSNENYSRQRVEFSTLPPDSIGGLETGRGIVLSGITQVVDSFLETRLTDSVQEQNSAEMHASFLRSVDSVFNEVSGVGINSSMSEFFDSWVALTAEPESTSARNNVLNKAQAIADLFSQYSTALQGLRTTIDNQISATIPFINDKLEEIQNINQQIQDADVDPLSYKDLRRQAINELAQYVDLNVVESGESVQLYTTSGLPLLNGVDTATFSVTRNVSNNNLYDISVTMGSTTTDVTDDIQSGQLHGLLTARDTDISNYLTKLDTLAYTIVTQVNSLHTTGYDLAAGTGDRFFTNLASSTNAAQSMSLHSSVDGTPAGIAIAGASDEVPGGNTIGLSIAALADSSGITFGSTTNSFSGYYSDLLAEIGSDARIATDTEEFEDNVLQQVQLERMQISGVNVDEEEINLVKFQAAFQASGRLIQIADSILQTLIDALTA